MIALLCGAFCLGGSPLETLREFLKTDGSAGAMSKLRDRYAAELETMRPEEGRETVYFATLPYYVLALAVMEDAILVTVDWAATEDEEQRKILKQESLVLQAELEILAEEIQRLSEVLRPEPRGDQGALGHE